MELVEDFYDIYIYDDESFVKFVIDNVSIWVYIYIFVHMSFLGRPKIIMYEFQLMNIDN